MFNPLRPHTFTAACGMPGVAGTVVGLILLLPTLAFGAFTEPWNAALPTLGGKQVWQDTRIDSGWRVQKNILTGHFRLLDPKDRRRAWGPYAHCMTRFDELREAGAVRPRGDHLVLLVHGIGRSTGTFRRLERALLRAGYDAVAITYPSTRGTLAEHAAALELILDRAENTKTVSFVSHSMGGLVLRHLLAAEGRWQTRIKIGRTVMIAPPNQGSRIAEHLKDTSIFRWVYGRAGQELTLTNAPFLPPFNHELGIIAGGTGGAKGFNPLLDGDNDGTVRLAETRLEGASRYRVVSGTHTFLPGKAATVAATINFLSHGKF